MPEFAPVMIATFVMDIPSKFNRVRFTLMAIVSSPRLNHLICLGLFISGEG